MRLLKGTDVAADHVSCKLVHVSGAGLLSWNDRIWLLKHSHTWSSHECSLLWTLFLSQHEQEEQLECSLTDQTISRVIVRLSWHHIHLKGNERATQRRNRELYIWNNLHCSFTLFYFLIKLFKISKFIQTIDSHLELKCSLLTQMPHNEAVFTALRARDASHLLISTWTDDQKSRSVGMNEGPSVGDWESAWAQSL